MAALWIVHRDPGRRLALTRLAAEADALVGAPGERVFETSPDPDVILLGVGGDFEAELEFAHRFAPRLRSAAWVLVPEAVDLPEARRLFDTLHPDLLAFPPDARSVRAAIATGRLRRRADPLSERRTRDGLAARFARWFADLDLPEVLRALDPHLARVPLLVRGEPGTGRSLLARYVHAFGGTTGGAYVTIACPTATSAHEIAAEIARSAARPRAQTSLTVCLEEVDRLAPSVQSEVQSWIEIAPPEGVPHTTWLRWIGTAGDTPALPVVEPPLFDALGGIAVRLPPVRERPRLVQALVGETGLAWAATHGERPRRFDESALEALREYPWPGNLRELETVVLRTLAADSSDPITAEQLRFDRDGGPGALEIAPREELVAPQEPPRADAAAMEFDEVLEGLGETPEDARSEPPNALPAVTPVAEDPLARRVLGALAHELRNPLVPIRTLAQLLPERFGDPEFRATFAQRVSSDVRRIEATLDRLTEFADLGPARDGTVDVAGILDALLEGHRDAIQRRRLLVLKELDRSQPTARGDATHLQFALSALLDKALELVPDRGDLYLASKHHASGLRGEPSVRVLLRYHSPVRIARKPGIEGVSLAETALEIVLAESVVRDLGGRLTVDSSDADETVILIDLPA
jgi:DNA-binding NtrC family response regulator